MLVTSASANIITFDIALNTTPLMGHPAGPFSLAFQLADGSGTGNGNNAAILTGFRFGTGGAVSGSPTTSDGATGDLNSGVILTDVGFANIFYQSFVPGDVLMFRLNLTTNVEDASVPDGFIFAILDQTRSPLPTTAGSPLDVLLQMNIDSENPTVTAFSGDIMRAPAGGGPSISLEAPRTVVPEPANWTSFGIGFLLLTSVRRMRNNGCR